MVLPETVLGHRIHGMGVLEVDGRSHLRMRGILAADPVLWAHQRVCPVLATRAPAPGPHGECRTRQSPALGRRRRGRRRRRELVRDRRERGRRDEQGERHGAEEQAPRVTSSLPRTGGRVGLRPVRARPRPSRAHRSIGARPFCPLERVEETSSCRSSWGEKIKYPLPLLPCCGPAVCQRKAASRCAIAPCRPCPCRVPPVCRACWDGGRSRPVWLAPQPCAEQLGAPLDAVSSQGEPDLEPGTRSPQTHPSSSARFSTPCRRGSSSNPQDGHSEQQHGGGPAAARGGSMRAYARDAPPLEGRTAAASHLMASRIPCQAARMACICPWSCDAHRSCWGSGCVLSMCDNSARRREAGRVQQAEDVAGRRRRRAGRARSQTRWAMAGQHPSASRLCVGVSKLYQQCCWLAGLVRRR